jgi:hypothetical protein
MLSIQEIHYYNRLVESENVHNLIKCQFDSSDIVVTKVDEDDKPYFFCLGCDSVFKLSQETEKIIKITIDKFISRG